MAASVCKTDSDKDKGSNPFCYTLLALYAKWQSVQIQNLKDGDSSSSSATFSMKANSIPCSIRLQNRIAKLQSRYDNSRDCERGNPYYFCKFCGIHDPELSIRWKHFRGCEYQDQLKEIEYYKSLLVKKKL